MLSMTYGELPSVKEFNRLFKTWAQDFYQIHLKGEDLRVGQEAVDRIDAAGEGYGSDHLDQMASGANAMLNKVDTWNLVHELTEMFHEGEDEAGNLASGILYTLNIEWI